MRIKYFFVTLVVNIFIMFMVTLFQEYSGITDSFKNLNTNVGTSVNSAVNTAMSSEEFFTDEYNTALASRSQSYKSSDRFLYATQKYMRGGTWIEGNTYILAMYMEEHGELPLTQHVYNGYASGIDVKDIYEFLFGTTGSDYNSPSLKWANIPDGTTYINDSNARVPNDDFLNFFNGVGKKITISGFTVKRRAMSGRGSIYASSYYLTNNIQKIPTLAQMGLKLTNYNKATYSTTHDNFTSVDHQGKLVSGSTENSTYYLTPYSLGVTYLPPKVLKMLVRTNLENSIRFSKCKSSPLKIGQANMNNVYASADGCLDTSVYDDGTGNAGVTSQDHTDTRYAEIMNDGDIEYDLATLSTRVDYFVVDFYDDANWKIVNEIEGATAGDASLLQTLPSRLKDTDTTTGGTGNGNRIVAKVTTKVKIHIPYKSPVLQWFVHNTSTSTTEHFDVASWNVTAGDIVENESGVWYVYTTYAAVGR